MIFLDTNYLIGFVSIESTIKAEVERWVEAEEPLGASAIAWSEFLIGPLTDGQRREAEIILDEIVPFGTAEGECAAQMLRGVERKRERKVDAFIAATAIVAGAKLATKNGRDFAPFLSAGLKLA